MEQNYGDVQEVDYRQIKTPFELRRRYKEENESQGGKE